MLDPACGDGRFLVAHPNSVGVEQDVDATHTVHEKTPGSLIHQGDFFAWAEETHERFDCAAGTPPFIRYQRLALYGFQTSARSWLNLGVGRQRPRNSVGSFGNPHRKRAIS